MVLIALSAKQRGTKFSKVRFGNILGSRGSVITLFKQQIKASGAVKVTVKNIIRYFMTIREAIKLVLQAVCVQVVMY
jgi:FlaA1/EpsC-like NDP-sugar epimerase